MTILLCLLWFVAGVVIGVWLGFRWASLAVALAVRDGTMDKIVKDYEAMRGEHE